MVAKVMGKGNEPLHTVAALVPGIIFSYEIKSDRLTLFSEKYEKYYQGLVIENWTEYFKKGNLIYSSDFNALGQFIFDITVENKALETKIRVNIFGNGYRQVVIRAKKVQIDEKNIVVGTIIDSEDIKDGTERRSTKSSEARCGMDETTGLLGYVEFVNSSQAVINGLAGRKSIGKRAVIYSDFANFKYINSIYGFEVGDMLLAEYAQTLNDRLPNAFAHCRCFADNFITFADVPDEDFLIKMLTKMNENFQDRQNTVFPEGNIKIYTGVYFLQNDETDIKAAIDNANTARKYAKKRQTPGCMIFNKEIKKMKEQDVEITASFRRAMTNNEIKVFLQPKVSLAQTELIGAEALVRWIKADGSIRYPDEFIPVLERNSQIVELDYYVFEQVCKLMRGWKDEGRKLCPVSVNFSRVHIFYGEMAEKLKAITGKYDLPNDLFEIEITETAFSCQHERLIYMIADLRECGFKVSIDDFGSGYSSLKMLTEVSANVVKMDKEFIRNSDLSEQKKNIIKETIRLAKAAEMEVLFEGVENEEQVSLLKEAGCDSVQGYFFAKPMPVMEFEALWLNRLA